MTRVVHNAAQAIESHRCRLFEPAYRMLGSGSEAEDIVQGPVLALGRD